MGSSPASPKDKAVEGYLEEHVVVDEAEEVAAIELETSRQQAKQLVYSDRQLKLSSSHPSKFHKQTEIWASTPVGLQIKSAMAAASNSARSVSRRLAFSGLGAVRDMGSSTEDTSIQDPKDQAEDVLDFEQENLDLKKQNLKLADDLKDLVVKLNYAEDRNQVLEARMNQIETSRTEQEVSNQRTRAMVKELSMQLLEQSEANQSTKEELQEKCLRISRLEKEVENLKLEKQELQADLEKAYSEPQWYQTSLAALKKELRMTQEAIDVDSMRCVRLEMEKVELSAILQELRGSYEKIQQEKYELEAFAHAEVSKNARNSHMNSTYDFDDLETMDSKDIYATAFPPVPPGASIFAEIQSTLDKPMGESKSVTDFGTQTDEDVQEKLPMIDSGSSPEYLWNNVFPEEVNLKSLKGTMHHDHNKLSPNKTSALNVAPGESNWLGSARRCCEWIFSEFNWPWTMEKTWIGIRRSFAIILVVYTALLICRMSVLPSCGFSVDAESFVKLSHIRPPRI